ncbi:hypothetical protein L596_008944 [Steinernema carpocapsae]|uniref:Uncharacterized protein n=1 Tax=Steinernema carpocapsae TaxID=34508 RepID=A0A4V6A6I4_STECR|nr:hypothetical protein L596_008944 [Steinernema carpocapsae]
MLSVHFSSHLRIRQSQRLVRNTYIRLPLKYASVPAQRQPGSNFPHLQSHHSSDSSPPVLRDFPKISSWRIFLGTVGAGLSM